MTTTLPHIPDPLALHLLSTVAGPRLRASPSSLPPPADLLAALTDTFGPASATPSTQADLARAALSLAASDPTTATAIETLLERTTPDSYPIAETIALVTTITAALAILQTELTIERTTTGKYRIKLHKKPASDALLKTLAHAVMRALGATSEKPPPRLLK